MKKEEVISKVVKLDKGLRTYNDIYKRRETAKLGEIAEARAYFGAVSSEFGDRADTLGTILSSKKEADLIASEGVQQELFAYDDDTVFALNETTTKTVTLDVPEIIKMKGFIDGKYFVTKEVVNRELILDELEKGIMDPLLKPYVTVYSQTGLGIRKKVTRTPKAKKE